MAFPEWRRIFASHNSDQDIEMCVPSAADAENFFAGAEAAMGQYQ